MNKTIFLSALLILLGGNSSAFANDTTVKNTAKIPFDRLFTTYEQRKRLNRANEDDSEISGNLDLGGESVAANQEITLKFNGYIKSQNGKSQFWVTKSGVKNHKVLMQPELERVRKLPIYSAQRTRQMKPGQTWLIHDNKVLESYEIPDKEKEKLKAIEEEKKAAEEAATKNTKKISSSKVSTTTSTTKSKAEAAIDAAKQLAQPPSNGANTDTNESPNSSKGKRQNNFRKKR